MQRCLSADIIMFYMRRHETGYLNYPTVWLTWMVTNIILSLLFDHGLNDED